MQTDTDTALLETLKKGEASHDVLMAAHDRLAELLKQKGDMFKQLVEQLNEIDALKDQLKKN